MMPSQPIWIGIVITAFVVGLGSTYLIFHTAGSDVNTSPEIMNDSMMSQQWMDSDMMNTLMNDPEMQKMIMATMHDSNQIQLMEDMMDEMMERMKTDPELEQAMMEHMARMKSSRNAMMENMDNQTMNDMMEMNP